MYRSLFFCLLAVTTIVGFFSMSSQSPIRLCRGPSCWPCACLLRNPPQTLLSSGFIVDAAGIIHSSEGEQNVALSSSLSLKIFLASFPRIFAGTSLLSCSLSWRSVLTFHSVGISLMKNFNLYFPERRTSFFSDVCLAQCSPRESYSSNWFQYFYALPANRCRIWRLSVLWSHTFHNSYCTFVIALFRLFGWSSTFQSGKEHLSAEFSSRFSFIELTLGRMRILTRWFGASTFQEVFTGFCLWRFLFSTLFYLVLLMLVDQRVAPLLVSALHDHFSHAGNCIGHSLRIREQQHRLPQCLRDLTAPQRTPNQRSPMARVAMFLAFHPRNFQQIFLWVQISEVLRQSESLLCSQLWCDQCAHSENILCLFCPFPPPWVLPLLESCRDLVKTFFPFLISKRYRFSIFTFHGFVTTGMMGAVVVARISHHLWSKTASAAVDDCHDVCPHSCAVWKQVLLCC